MTTCYALTPSPIGELLVLADDQGAHHRLLRRRRARRPRRRPRMAARRPRVRPRPPISSTAYFEGELTTFDLELAPTGTPFQLEVWRALSAIPYAETLSYREIAEEVGRPLASRAVGQANGRNPISIIVPCHRVIAADGTLGGYGWGLDRKQWLLDLEAGANVLAGTQPLWNCS